MRPRLRPLGIRFSQRGYLYNIGYIKIGDPFIVALYNYYHIWQLESSSNWIWLAAALGYDFGWYWTHRLSHEMNFAWAGELPENINYITMGKVLHLKSANLEKT